MGQFESRELGKNIRCLREDKDMMQKELAKKCGISAMALSYIERGMRSPSLTTLAAISKALDCPMDELLKTG